VADKSSQLVLTALARAASAGSGVPWHGGRSAPGLFPTTAVGKQAAQRSRDEGLLRPTAEPAPAAGRPTGPELGAITDKGMAYLLSQVSPKQVLEDMVRALEAREAQVGQLLAAVRTMQTAFQALKSSAEQALAAAGRPGRDLKALFADFCRSGETNGESAPVPAAAPADEAILACLAGWSAPMQDCPLPELYRQACARRPGLSVGQFHDALRRLHDAEQVYLHPWAGPLYELPEPPYALLVGHLVAYYASLRKDEG
jgi:hypothetical protein